MPNKPIRKLSEVQNYSDIFPDTSTLDEYQDETIIIDAVKFRDSRQYGEFCIITAQIAETNEVIHLRTTSMFVIQQLHDLDDNNSLPVECKIIQKGKSWLLE